MVEKDVYRLSKGESVEKRLRKKTVSHQSTLKILCEQYVVGTMSMVEFLGVLGTEFVSGIGCDIIDSFTSSYNHKIILSKYIWADNRVKEIRNVGIKRGSPTVFVASTAEDFGLIGRIVHRRNVFCILFCSPRRSWYPSNAWCHVLHE
ncbi:hypothetical protein DPMN_036377 [Dreissena polymorpha]|uniref:Uncharacterized protein n=1 Tax=Dreissena polymorpha TaxID=45954 RepID=A0A9D4RNU0_DREPO|nr:hypothetical protein DPMN_036377 [Dreissena polymorpha]